MRVLIIFLFVIFFQRVFSMVNSTLSSSTPLNISIHHSLLSGPVQVFELGFFIRNPSSGWFLGIWDRRLPNEVVWVANRDSPLSKPVGTLEIINTNLHLLDHYGKSVWSTNGPSQIVKSVLIGELLDSGNLVLRYKNDSSGVLWQSFDNPTDTLLPGMLLGWDLKSGLNRKLVSWRNVDDPSLGDYTYKVEIRDTSESYIRRKGKPIFRSGPWKSMSDMTTIGKLKYGTYNLTVSSDYITYSFSINNASFFSTLRLSYSGALNQSLWTTISGEWKWLPGLVLPSEQCDDYNRCGVNGLCDINTPHVCNCMKGFKPRHQEGWELKDTTQGCVRKTSLSCPGDGFLKLQKMKLPDTTKAIVDMKTGLKECKEKCSRNCNCTAYANENMHNGGSGCVLWIGDLHDLRVNRVAGEDLFVRTEAFDIGKEDKPTKPISTKTIILIVGVGLVIVVLVYFIVFFFWNKYKRPRGNGSATEIAPPPIVDLQLVQMELETVAMATQNFSDSNKIGQGGYGVVYKGMLLDGQEIAVKRLSKRTPEGIDGVNTEVRLIGSIQHVNLVRLLGYCYEEFEILLIYEYLENSSLDTYLFDNAKSYKLNWEKRHIIINGIARGLLYLHHDSRVRIIHCDLKPNNVLLDKDMVPKISDFGMAKIFGRDEIEANTQAVAGTYGYMSPEYAIDKTYSVKSDVFSFGVVVLEILSGKKNLDFYYSNEEHLLSFIWKNWMEGKGLEIIDPVIIDSSSTFRQHEVLRCIQIGLLCVQELAEDRPTMSSVITMLVSETTEINQPKPPGYFIGRTRFEIGSSSRKTNGESWTVAQITNSIVEGR